MAHAGKVLLEAITNPLSSYCEWEAIPCRKSGAAPDRNGRRFNFTPGRERRARQPHKKVSGDKTLLWNVPARFGVYHQRCAQFFRHLLTSTMECERCTLTDGGECSDRFGVGAGPPASMYACVLCVLAPVLFKWFIC